MPGQRGVMAGAVRGVRAGLHDGGELGYRVDEGMPGVNHDAVRLDADDCGSTAMSHSARSRCPIQRSRICPTEPIRRPVQMR